MGYNAYTGSTQTKTALLTNILGMFSELYTSIAAIAAGSGIVVDSGDEVPGYLDGKLAAGSANITLTSDGATNATLTVELGSTITTRTFVDPAIEGCIKEEIFAITDAAAFEIDPSNGSIQTIILGDDRTPKATNFANGESVLLMVNDGTARSITWTDATFGVSGVVWKTNSGNAPTLETSGYTGVVLWKQGDQVYGARVGNS